MAATARSLKTLKPLTDGVLEPLISREMWYRVQNILTARQVSGEKTQTPDHYLNGTIYCGDCGPRHMVTHAKNRHGNVYPHFICAGRHSKRTTCIRQAMPVADIAQRSRTTTGPSRYPNTSSPRCGTCSPASGSTPTTSTTRTCAAPTT